MGILLSPALISAGEGYISLVGIKGIDALGDPGKSSSDFIKTLYQIAIVGAALVAVIKLILAGAKYVMSGIVTDKEDAKRDIRSALVGLLIIIAAVTILTTINPNISNLKPLQPIIVEEPDWDIEEDGPDQDSVEYWCEEYGGEDNCEIMSCDFIENGNSLTLWNTFIYLIDSGDRFACDIVCPTVFSGHVVEKSFVGNTGKCVYPSDWEVYIDRATEEESETLSEYDITDGAAVEFTSTPFDSRTVIDDRRENPRLSYLEDEDFVGFLVADWNSAEGKELLSEYNGDRGEYEQRVLRRSCGSGNSLVSTGMASGDTAYYCVSR